jgi:hypothetical protein
MAVVGPGDPFSDGRYTSLYLEKPPIWVFLSGPFLVFSHVSRGGIFAPSEIGVQAV